MEQSSDKNQEGGKVYEITTVPFSLKEIKENLTINSNISTKLSKDHIINQAYKFHSEGKISEALKYYQYFINQGFKNYRVFSNYGVILRELGKLQEAELSTRKAIELNPNFANAHYNLANILIDLGSLKEAELSTRKAIELNPNFAEAYSNLGNILRDLGNLKEAELLLRKAIELNPNFAIAYSNLANILIDLGRLKEADLSLRKAIDLDPNFAIAYLNLGNILSNLGKLQEAELSLRKVIELDPNFATAYLNLGNVLSDIGNLQEAKMFYCNATELQPDLTRAYYCLSTLPYSNDDDKKWQEKLFSKHILNNKSTKDQIDIYFARANILHKEKNYKESSRYLELANKLKLDLKPSKSNDLISKSKILLIESKKSESNITKLLNSCESIFIVGMPRSGSTLVESILSMNSEVNDLGEMNILEESFQESKEINQKLSLYELYLQKVKDLKNQSHITTNKNLYNYQYTGIIAGQIPGAKIIHCFRNPLDNILSIYRAHFVGGNEYSSSLIECTEVYLDQEELMKYYKKRFRSKIYDLNYDSLVANPNQEIQSLISWLGWKWENLYLLPHLNKRSVSTRSRVEVRSPINSKSIGGWKNYKDMLKPSIEILTQTDKYRNLIS